MNVMRATDYNEAKTINTALIDGVYAARMNKRQGTISSKLTVLVLLFLMCFAVWGCGQVNMVPEEAVRVAAQCKSDGFSVGIKELNSGKLRVYCFKDFTPQ